ncbi:MAG: DUF4870 domain-containing protein [Anaerolineae bacterium]
MSDIDRETRGNAGLQEEVPEGVTRKLESDAAPPEPKPRQAETKKLKPEPVDMVPAATPSAYLGLTRQEMNWAAVAHASILLTFLLAVTTGGIAAILGPIVPALIWYSFRDRSKYVADQARQATIYQVAGLLALLALAVVGAVLVAVGLAVSAVLLVVIVGVVLLPIMIIVALLWVVALVFLPIAQVIYGCYAALEAYNGRPFRYRWIADLIDRYEAQA